MFDDIPEDCRQSFPCPECEEGNVTKNDLGIWECDTCSFAVHSSDEARPKLTREMILESMSKAIPAARALGERIRKAQERAENQKPIILR